MPHTTRRRVPSIKKHRHVEGDDGWTHVVRGPRKGDCSEQAMLPALTFPSLEGMIEGQDRISRSIVRKGLTDEKVCHLISNAARQWTESSSHAHVKQVFEARLDNLEISSCVCLALGSFTADDFHGRPQVSLHQLAAFEIMLQILSTFPSDNARRGHSYCLERKHKIDEIYFQDPCFNDLDEKVLRLRGYSVLQRPAALDHITSTTFLYAPCAIWSSLISVFQVAYPSLVATNDIKQHLQDRYVSVAPKHMAVLVDTLKRTASPWKLWLP